MVNLAIIVSFIFLSFYDSTHTQSVLPDSEYIVYETNDKGKIGMIEVILKKDTVGYNVIYKSDRIVEAILDTINLQTLYLNKIIRGRWELSVKKNHLFEVNYQGRKNHYDEKNPIYDRHTLDFVLRGFKYQRDFKKRIRLNVPEFMIINADLEVIGEDIVSVPAGTFDCWKIMMIPRVVFTKMKFYFHIEKSYPHRFVKYTDSSGKNSIVLKEYR
ncbi:MAG: hypothetical protein ABIL44_00080 [candidate division WOR-3 bacterium]